MRCLKCKKKSKATSPRAPSLCEPKPARLCFGGRKLGPNFGELVPLVDRAGKSMFSSIPDALAEAHRQGKVVGNIKDVDSCVAGHVSFGYIAATGRHGYHSGTLIQYSHGVEDIHSAYSRPKSDAPARILSLPTTSECEYREFFKALSDGQVILLNHGYDHSGLPYFNIVADTFRGNPIEVVHLNDPGSLISSGLLRALKIPLDGHARYLDANGLPTSDKRTADDKIGRFFSLQGGPFVGLLERYDYFPGGFEGTHHVIAASAKVDTGFEFLVYK